MAAAAEKRKAGAAKTGCTGAAPGGSGRATRERICTHAWGTAPAKNGRWGLREGTHMATRRPSVCMVRHRPGKATQRINRIKARGHFRTHSEAGGERRRVCV